MRMHACTRVVRAAQCPRWRRFAQHPSLWTHTLQQGDVGSVLLVPCETPSVPRTWQMLTCVCNRATPTALPQGHAGWQGPLQAVWGLSNRAAGGAKVPRAQPAAPRTEACNGVVAARGHRCGLMWPVAVVARASRADAGRLSAIMKKGPCNQCLDVCIQCGVVAGRDVCACLDAPLLLACACCVPHTEPPKPRVEKPKVGPGLGWVQLLALKACGMAGGIGCEGVEPGMSAAVDHDRSTTGRQAGSAHTVRTGTAVRTGPLHTAGTAAPPSPLLMMLALTPALSLSLCHAPGGGAQVHGATVGAP